MYGLNPRLAEGIPSIMILRNVTALIPVYSVGSFFCKGWFLPRAECSFTCIYF